MIITIIENEIDRNVNKCPFCSEKLIYEEKLRHCVLYHNSSMIYLFEKLYKKDIEMLDWLINKPYIVFK